jgi:hypothetical protein
MKGNTWSTAECEEVQGRRGESEKGYECEAKCEPKQNGGGMGKKIGSIMRMRIFLKLGGEEAGEGLTEGGRGGRGGTGEGWGGGRSKARCRGANKSGQERAEEGTTSMKTRS